jgi:glucan-binding YG repeat protein
MKKSIKRFLPFVIVLALCMSLFTVSAFAVDKRNPEVVDNGDGTYSAVDKDGNTIRNGWVHITPDTDHPKENDYWVYASKGTLVSGWQNIDGDWYYFYDGDYVDMDGKTIEDVPFMYSDGFQYVEDDVEPENSKEWRDAKDVYLFNKDGSVYSGPSGWVSVPQDNWVWDEKAEDYVLKTQRVWYFVNSDGSRYKGWVEDDGNLYAVDPRLETGIQTGYAYPGAWVDYENELATWEEVPHHFINKDGTIVRNGWGSYLYETEEWDEAEKEWVPTMARRYYYAGSDGTLVSGWKQIDGKWYFFGSTDPDYPNRNNMRAGEILDFDGVKYYVDKTGARVEGWAASYLYDTVDADGNDVTTRDWAYFEPGTGVMVEDGWKKIDGKWYIFSDGIMQHDTPVKYAGNEYYLGSDGAMITGWAESDEGEWYYYNDDGALQTSTWIEDNGSWYFVDSTGEMVRNDEIDGFYVGSDGAWIPD